MIDLRNKKVTVMGLGLHGGALGTIQWLHAQGAQITVTDMKSAADLAPTLAKLQDLAGITYVLGEHREADFTEADMVIRNPGVRHDSPFLQLATAHQVPIEMDSSLFFQACPSTDIIGITGSKGKSTTTHVLNHVLSTGTQPVVTVGFDQISPLGALSHITKETLVIFELSSWRLEGLQPHQLNPHTAVVTSIYRDHLNTYDSYEDYIATKKSIATSQIATDWCLLNADNDILRNWAGSLPGQVLWYSVTADIPGNGIFIRDNHVVVRLDNQEINLLSITDLPLTEPHALRNTLPAVLIAHQRRFTVEQLQTALRTLQGLPHRLERVRTLNKVTYINDSAATMPDATIAALQSFKDQPIVHILGGSDKDLWFEKLAQAETHANIRALVVLPGTATQRMLENIKAAYADTTPPPIIEVESMSAAVQAATTAAKPGDTVLLSPGATSFGLFKHEFDRGDQFRTAVLNL